MVIRAFLIALQFLTVIPVRLRAPPVPGETGYSLLMYPLVGALLGLVLALAASLLDTAAPAIAAALVLTLWVLLTGALHLDGLADSADAWIGGRGDRQRTLDIMKDPYCGPTGASALILILLLKFTALTHLLDTSYASLLVLAPLLGRTTLVLLFATTPYVRGQGLGRALADASYHTARLSVTGLTVISAGLVFGSALFWPLVAATSIFLVARAWMMRRLGGSTGDTSGALIEMVEAAVLLSLALPT